MNHFYTHFVLICLFLFAGCSNSDNVNRQTAGVPAAEAIPTENDSPDVGWPKDPQKLVDHLNDWHADELLAYNEPERFPNRMTSGETNGWISVHEEQLKELNTEISDRKQQKYVIVEPAK